MPPACKTPNSSSSKMENPSDSILESREELMVSATGEGKPTRRVAHFIKPSSTTSIKGPVFELPLHSLSLPTPPLEPKKWPLDVSFLGWRFNARKWKEWVEKMASIHKSTWEKAGIYEAILTSTYEIKRDSNLVFRLAEKWCTETNTFVFPWGEATISLEDMMVFGYSVLGSPVFSPLETEELKGIEEELENARLEIARTKAKKACIQSWAKKFMETGSKIEHEACLVFWLSRYVFPNARDSIRKQVFSIAIHLARGEKIALAPAVLASIYRDLSLLKCKIIESAIYESKHETLALWSPFQLVQIWACERFQELQPRPRLARWDKLKHKVENVRLALDSTKDNFIWLPYGRTVKIREESSSYDEEFESFARCLRVSALVGLDCIEHYFPQRFSMQFGFDQDLPGCVLLQIDNPEIAWSDYSRPIGDDVMLDIRTRPSESSVTTRYLEWWKLSMVNLKVARESVRTKEEILMVFRTMEKRLNLEDKNKGNNFLNRKTSKGLKQRNTRSWLKLFKNERKVDGKAALKRKSPPESCEKLAASSKRKKEDNSEKSACSLERQGEDKDASNPTRTVPFDSIMMQELINSPFPPGFPPKSSAVKARDSDEDKITIAEMLRSYKKHENVKQETVYVEDSSSEDDEDIKIVEPLTKDRYAANEIDIPSVPPGFASKEDEVTISEMLRLDENPEVLGNKKNGLGKKNSSSDTSRIPRFSVANDGAAKCVEKFAESADVNSSNEARNHPSAVTSSQKNLEPLMTSTTTKKNHEAEGAAEDAYLRNCQRRARITLDLEARITWLENEISKL